MNSVLPRGGGPHRSAIEAVTPDRGSNWMAPEDLEYPGQGGGRTRAALRRVGFSAQELDGCSVRWRSGFPRIAGPPVLSSGCWVHDGFQMLSGLSDAPTLTTRCRCQTATEYRINIAHLVLFPIRNDELSSEKRKTKRTNTEHDVRGRQGCTYTEICQKVFNMESSFSCRSSLSSQLYV